MVSLPRMADVPYRIAAPKPPAPPIPPDPYLRAWRKLRMWRWLTFGFVVSGFVLLFPGQYLLPLGRWFARLACANFVLLLVSLMGLSSFECPCCGKWFNGYSRLRTGRLKGEGDLYRPACIHCGIAIGTPKRSSLQATSAIVALLRGDDDENGSQHANEHVLGPEYEDGRGSEHANEKR